MKYRLLILIIIIISPGQILLSYIANTTPMHAHTHTRTHARTRTHTHRRGVHCSMGRWRPPVTARSAGDNDSRCFIQINTRERGRPGLPHVLCFSRIKKLLGLSEMRTRERMYCQSIRHLPRRSSKNCDLQFDNSDRFKENYSIDTSVCQCTHAHVRTRTHTRLEVEHASFTHRPVYSTFF